MDLKNLTSSCIKREGGLYHATLPCIDGYYETAFYSHNGAVMDFLTGSLGERLTFSIIDGDLHHIFLVSTILDSLFLRIIDTDDFYHDNMIILDQGEIFTFSIRGKIYFVLIFIDSFGQVQHYTNFGKQIIFSTNFENDTFSVINRDLGSVVFSCSFYPKELPPKEKKQSKDGIGSSFLLMGDMLAPEKGERDKIYEYLKTNKGKGIEVSISEIDDVSLYITDTGCNNTSGISDFIKLLGFLGTHQCIQLQGDLLTGYITLDEIVDLDISMPEGFSTSEKIELIDPRWHEMRKSLMELQYLKQVNALQIQALQGSIASINTLQSPYLKFQKDHSTLTLLDLEKIEKQYTIYLDTLIQILKNSIS